MKTFKLTEDSVRRLAKEHETPLLVVSLKQIAYNYEFLRNQMPRLRVFYAMKANPADCIVRTLADLGACFDVASDGEMLQLAALGVSADRMVYANPYKTPKGLRTAKMIGVNKFTFDSESEIYKMADAVPGALALLRIRVDNPKAMVDLNKKFGASPDEAIRLLKIAKARGLDAAGLCFHVGSQSATTDAHTEAFRICRRLFDEAAKEGMRLRVLDIGGGLPIPTPGMQVDLVKMMEEINLQVETLFQDAEIWAEPGRYICGTAVNLIVSVIGTQRRNQQKWYFLDEGIYGTFSAILFDHWDFVLESFKEGPLVPATFAGPSCDSLDVLFRDRLSPELAIGDLLLVKDCGAYTSASATEFNGFAKAPIVALEECDK